MATYVPYNDNVKVSGITVLMFVDSIRKGKEKRIEILKKHGIEPNPNEFISQKTWLEAFKEIADRYGDNSLFAMGAAAVEHAEFPPMKNLEEALNSINMAYHLSHQLDGKLMFDQKTGEFTEGAGGYTLLEFDGKNRKAVIRSNTPYPSRFDQGSVDALVRRFKPEDSTGYEVKVDVTKERRSEGGDSCTYLISW